MPLRLRDFVVENTAGATNQDRRTNEGVRGGRHDAATSVKTGSVRGRGGRGIDNDSASVLLASVLLTCLLLAVRPTTSGHFRGGRGSGRRGRGGRDGSRGELSWLCRNGQKKRNGNFEKIQR